MMRSAILAGVLAGLLPCAAAQAQINARPHLVVRSGAPIKVFNAASINPDCSSLGPFTINLVTAPQGGQATVGERQDYVAFPPGNPRAACNKRKIAATEIFYRSNPGFTGYDSFTVEAIAPNGVASTRTFSVEVR